MGIEEFTSRDLTWISVLYSGLELLFSHFNMRTQVSVIEEPGVGHMYMIATQEDSRTWLLAELPEGSLILPYEDFVDAIRQKALEDAQLAYE